MNRSINKSNEISQGHRATHGHMGGTWQRTSPGWDQVISNLTIMHLCFEIDECWVWNWQKFQIMLMRIFFDVQGDYRKIGDVILKNLNQNTMEHYGRWTFETKMCPKAFFAIHLISISMQQNIWNLNAGTLTHTGLYWINWNRQFTRAQSLNRYECWKNLKSLSLFYPKSLSFFWRWLLWIFKEFEITFTFFY